MSQKMANFVLSGNGSSVRTITNFSSVIRIKYFGTLESTQTLAVFGRKIDRERSWKHAGDFRVYLKAATIHQQSHSIEAASQGASDKRI
jgi:hypothetical protein